MSENKELTIGDYKFRIEKLSFQGRCDLRKLAKGIGPGNWLIGIADDDIIRTQTKLFDRLNKQWIDISREVFLSLTPEEGNKLLAEVNQFNEDFQKVQPQEQTAQS